MQQISSQSNSLMPFALKEVCCRLGHGVSWGGSPGVAWQLPTDGVEAAASHAFMAPMWKG